ncbi:flavodoxin [Pontibacillus halophilus JSM 076056 = DSM 19796]|uniref:Flavodoxin n=1 Tax=Pontibacillus halophilus JSM 076056 = DSM 19796 TaxID=1385510 RepID=A0A0A5GJ23_9BACI|nr:NAD(P)H-dependent oxidoreductase [Pontibacillus halophilus]KGX91145.1 flavodoxin [Pontibacillus halophilus JSM 076056 = DSM 19796]
MKRILLINGHEGYNKSKGNLNQTMLDEWKVQLEGSYELDTTIVDDGYDVEEEIEKWKQADIILMQTPVYWFSIPGKFKQYIDQVFMDNIFFTGSDRYGHGGLFTNKEYMLSFTWNAPESIFNNETAFYEGRSLDEAMLHLHKMNQYIGMKPLPTFSIHDVVKGTNMEHYKTKLRNHAVEVFGV